jgi:hypothetical protein
MKYNPTENPIIIKCKAHQLEPIDRLLEFQGNLKRLSEKNREKLIGSICTKGFIAPLFVWDDAGDWKLLDGHQRLKTLIWMREHGWDIPMLPVDIIEAEDEQDAKRKLLAITSQYGEFDANGYIEFTESITVDDFIRLTNDEWSLSDDANGDEIDDLYTKKIDAPIYEVTGEKPIISDLVNTEKQKSLEEEIEKSGVPDDIKDFLIKATTRHIVFNYHKIAEFYAHSDKKIQELMEKSALVIIDFNKAIEYGYTKLSEKIISQYEEEYEK